MEERLRSLMIEALAGNEQSYRRLLTEVGDRLRAYYARRLGPGHAATEDLVQEALLAVHMRRFTYDSERPFTAWLHAIARYKLIDYLRRSRAHRSLPIDDFDDLFAVDASEAAGASHDIGQLLEELPPRPRSFIRAVKIDGRSIAEVSAGSGVSESAVKVAIHRGLKQLAKRLRGTDAS